MKKWLIIALVISCFKAIKIIDIKNKDINENLALAIISNDTKRVVKLINQGANVNYKCASGWTLLMTASSIGSEEIVELLLREDVNINDEDDDKETALTIASKYGYKEIIKLFIEAEANLNHKNNAGETALLIGAKYGYKEIVELLMRAGASINHRNNVGETALMAGSKYGNKEIVELLLMEDANINDKDYNGETALIIASKYGYKEIVELLLMEGANINDKDYNGETALIIASKYGYKEMVELLMRVGASINHKNNIGETALMAGSKYGNKEIVKLLLEKEGNINEKNNHGFTALMLASQEGNTKIIELLIEKGANVNDKNEYGLTALMLASEKDHKKIEELLLKKASNVDDRDHDKNASIIESKKFYEYILGLSPKKEISINEKDRDGWTILMYASQRGYIELVEILLKAGADVNDNKNGCTALMIASEKGHIEIVKSLIREGANVNNRDYIKETALMKSSRNGYTILVELLIECGVDINAKNKYGATALMIALKNNCIETAEFLISKGADIQGAEIISLEDILIKNIKNRNIESSLSLIKSYKNKINYKYKDEEDNTFLHYVVSFSNNIKLLQELLKKGCSINAQNNKGETPIYTSLSRENIDEPFVLYLLEIGAILKPNSYIRGKALIDILLPYKKLCDKLVYEPISIKLLDKNNFINKNELKEIIRIIKVKDDDFEQEKDMIRFIKNVLLSNKNKMKIANPYMPKEDLQDVDLNIDVFTAIFHNFTINDYWDEVKSNLEYNIKTFIDKLYDIKNSTPIAKPNSESSNKDKAMYITFKAKKQLHYLSSLISLTAEKGKNNEKIIFAMNQILAELVCREGSLEAINAAVNVFTGEGEEDLKHDLAILLTNLRKEMLKEASRGKCKVKYLDFMEGKEVEKIIDPENPHLLIHLCNSFSNEIKVPVHVDEFQYDFIYNKSSIIKAYKDIYSLDKIVEYMINNIDPETNRSLWHKVKDYIERNIFKGRAVLQIDNFIYDDKYKIKKEALIALLINFEFLIIK